jgi:membrane-associated protein
VAELFDFLLHSDRHLLEFANAYGAWIYGLLFAIVFAETGCVVTPFLPGDSLLFAAGTLAGAGALDPVLTMVVIFVAAVAGDAVNYSIGRHIGPRIFRATDKSSRFQRLLNREHLDRAHAFFEKHGGKAIVLGRFVPIVRTFVPFVAGAAAMSRSTFVFYNFAGAAAWVAICVGAGIIFGQLEFVKDNFSLITIGIVFVSVLPIVFDLIRHRRRDATA